MLNILPVRSGKAWFVGQLHIPLEILSLFLVSRLSTMQVLTSQRAYFFIFLLNLDPNDELASVNPSGGIMPVADDRTGSGGRISSDERKQISSDPGDQRYRSVDNFRSRDPDRLRRLVSPGGDVQRLQPVRLLRSRRNGFL